MKIFPRVKAIQAGTILHPRYVVKAIGDSRDEPALVYSIPSRQGGKPSTKRIRESEWEAAYQQLLAAGQFTLDWFKKNMACASRDGQCSFRVTGEVFVFLGLARRVPKGRGSKYVLNPTLPSG